MIEHVFAKIYTAVARCFGSYTATTKGQTLTCENPGKAILEPLVLTEKIADFAGPNSDVTRRYIGIFTNMAMQFRHQRMTETHHFEIALTFGIEISSTLGAPHRKPCQTVLECLLETEKLENAQSHGRMESEASLVGSYGVKMPRGKPRGI